jgi:uncharacterized membrane protein YcaP (DUF421 family)
MDEPSVFDWRRLLMGEDLTYLFLTEVVFRSIVMFLIVLFILRLIGKRGIKQLSVFELALIISLGSAAGDPMFYYEVGLLPAIVVFIIIISLYKGITYLSEKSEKIEKFIEGEPIQLLENGTIKIENFNSEAIAQDEFFSQLRQKNVDHLGQVRKAFLENSGEVSLFYFEKDKILWGLPILPDRKKSISELPKTSPDRPHDHFACTVCGTLADNLSFNSNQCVNCGNSKWIPAKNNPRVV